MRSEVQVLLDPPLPERVFSGALAQLGERLICIQEVRSSILLGSTKSSQSEDVGPAVECAALNERAKCETTALPIRSRSTVECLAVQSDAAAFGLPLTSYREIHINTV